MCPGVTDLPIDRIAQAVQPTPAQRAALDELKDASVKAAEGLKVNCALQVAAFRAALGEAGYVERQNVAIDGAGLSAKQTIFRRRKGRRSNWPTKDSLTSSCACGLRLEARSCSDQRTSANRSS